MLCFQDCQFIKIKDNTIQLFMLYSKEISIWEVAVAAASDGSSLSTASSVADLCLLTPLCGSEVAVQMTSDTEH